MEAVGVDGGCDHDAQAWKMGEDAGCEWGPKMRHVEANTWRNIKKYIYLYILTGDELKDARDCEPLSFAEGEELSHKHKDAQDGEYAS